MHQLRERERGGGNLGIEKKFFQFFNSYTPFSVYDTPFNVIIFNQTKCSLFLYIIDI